MAANPFQRSRRGLSVRAVWYGVLGRLEVRSTDGKPVRVSGPARRQVLAALLCRAGLLVSVSTLVDDLWGAAPPRSAVGTLRSHVARLRDDLGRDAADAILLTEGDGYRLQVGPHELDAMSFQRLCEEAAGLGDRETGIRRYDEALALWRDEAYVEFGDAPFAVGERIRLAELRALARERRTDLALAAGSSGELVGELEQRVMAAPYRERGWEQLAVALYRAGRQGDALGACRRARQVLVEDLGVDPGAALQALETQLLRQDPDLLVADPPVLTRSRIDRCPYLGLAGYDERDAPLFVGRERLTSILAGRLADQSVVIVTGASGVGKSSLVRAGLVPALRAGALPGSAAWRIEIRAPGDAALGDDSGRAPDLLVLDQAEELFTGLDPDARDQWARRLARYVDESAGRLVLVLRSDYYGRLTDLEPLASFGEKTTVLVGPMRADELRRALVEPAAAAGLSLEPDLVETVMEDVAGQPEPLPLLSEAMVGTWQRRQGDVLTLAGYRLAGEVTGALESAAEACYAQLAEPERQAARHLLVRMATRSGAGWVRRPIARVDADDFDEWERSALSALIGARLMVASDERVEIAHDALLQHWPRLRGWLEERSLAAEMLEHLDQAAATWRASGRQDADLYRGPRLSAAIDWRAEHPADLSPAEEEFLEASARAADAELNAARAQTVREAKGRRNLRRVALGLAVTVALALGGGAIAVHERGTARTQATRARRAAVTASAGRLAALSAAAPDIATSSLLAVAGYRLQNTPETRGALLSADERSQSALWRIQTQFRPQRVVASPDGKLLATIDNHRYIDIWDVATRRHIERFYADAFDIVGITSDDLDVVTFGPANDESDDIGRVSLMSIATGRRVKVLTTAGDRLGTEPVMTTDGRWLLTATDRHRDDGTEIDIVDTTNAVAPQKFVESGRPVALAAGRTSLAIERSDGSADVRAVPSLRALGALARVPGAALQPTGPGAVGLSPDGSRLARIDPLDPRIVSVYRVGVPNDLGRQLPTQEQFVGRVAFSPDGAELAIGTEGGAVTVYHSADGTQLAALAGHVGPVHGIAWTGSTAPTGLYTVGLDSELISWNVGSLPHGMTESGPAVAAPDRGETFGHFVLGVTPTQGAGPMSQERGYLVDLDTGRRTSWLLGLHDDDYINQAVVSFDGKRALFSVENGTGDNRIQIWDLSRPAQTGQLQLPSGTAHFEIGLNAAISPDGTTAYSSLGAGRIGVFSLPSGRYLRSFDVRFAEPDAARIYAIPWMFDPNGRLLFGGFDPDPTQGPPPAPLPGPVDTRPPNQRLGLLDVKTGRFVAQTGLGDVTSPTAVNWSHDGSRLVVGTFAGTLSIYNARTFALEAEAGVVEPGWIKTAAFSPDDSIIVTGGTLGDISFYSAPDLRRLGSQLTIQAQNGGAFVWFDPHGDVDGYAPDPTKPLSNVDRWFNFRVDTPALVSAACDVAGTDISRSQWQRYVGDQPYRHVCP
jgi:DNA-binding SARP family transcriptional activator/WD40 repeat protein